MSTIPITNGCWRSFIWQGVCCSVIVFLDCGSLAEKTKDVSADSECCGGDIWRTAERCGVNSAYVYLRLHGMKLNYDDVLAEIAVTKNGIDMESLRTNISKLGINSEVVRETPGQLSSELMPCIAHLDLETSKSFDANSRGHFIVLIKVDGDLVTFVDGTTGILQTQSFDSFCRAWSGYLLVPQQLYGRVTFISLFFLITVIAYFLVIECRRQCIRWKSGTSEGQTVT